MKIDVSVNITAHSEGILLHKTLRSIYSGIDYARQRGVSIEVNISLDNADVETTRIAKEFKLTHDDLKISIYSIDVKDLGLSRNYLINKSSGKYIAFFDGDDFFTENYLYASFKLAETKKDPAVYSPIYMINFEGDHYLIIKQDSDSKEFNPINLFETNYFISQSFVHADIYKNIKYEANRDGYGMEDWHWNMNVIAAGYKFYNVPKTIFFYRRKKTGSLLSVQVENSATVRPSKLFLPDKFSELSASADHKPAENAIHQSDLVGQSNVFNRLKSSLRKYPRIYRYAQTQYNLHKSVYRAVTHGITGNNHTVIEEDMTTLEGGIPNRILDIGFDEEVMRLWGNLNQFETMIRASEDQPKYIPIVRYPTYSAISEIYLNFCKKHSGKEIKDIVLVPHIVAGGADLSAINLVRELSKNGRVLVITTIDVDSPWINKINSIKNVICLESKDFFKDISEEQRLNFMIKVIQHWGVERLSIINSEVGYKLATRFHQAIRSVGCKTYLYTYAFDMTDDGYLFNYIHNGLVEAYQGVDFYVTDCLGYKKQLEDINGFNPKKVIPLFLPISGQITSKIDYSQKNKILWASRIHNAKLIEVAVDVGRKLGSHGIELHMYGDLGEEYAVDNKFSKMIMPYKNIFYHGSYDGFNSLPIDKYDIFLFTSKNEGMPNVILEAIAANLFIIAPSVGGIPECITNDKNGNLVANKFDPESYLQAILSAYEDKAYAKSELIAKYNAPIIRRHSVESYKKEVKQLVNLSPAKI